MASDVPTLSEKNQQGRIGVSMVALAVTKELGWVFREKPTSDIGIDGEVEVRNDAGQSHGRIFAVQIKCGPSYLREQTDEAITFRGSYEHLRYWSDFTVPVALILCNPQADVCYWQAIDLRQVKFHEKSWSIQVPKTNVLNVSSRALLEKIARHLQKKDFLELSLRDWLGWRYLHQMRLASVIAQPHDYWWFSLLGTIGDDFYMIDYLFARVDGFDQGELEKFTEAIEVNHRKYGYGNVLIAFISESIDHLRAIPNPPTLAGVRIEFVPLLLELHDEPRLSELAAEGVLIVEYEFGPSDEQFREATPARKVSDGRRV